MGVEPAPSPTYDVARRSIRPYRAEPPESARYGAIMSADALTLQRYALAAFWAAFQRMQSSGGDIEAGYAAVGEVLFWSIVADDGYESGRLLKGQGYTGVRDKREPSLLGLRWARHRMTHPTALILDEGTHMSPPVLGGAPLGGWLVSRHMKWASEADVPVEEKYDSGRLEYRQYLQEKPVDEVVGRAATWLLGWPLQRVEALFGVAYLDPRR